MQPWPEIWAMPIPQFFAYASYSRWRTKLETDNIAKWHKQHKIR